MLLIGGLAVSGTATAADTIRLGFVADVSGIGASFYKSQKAGLDMFIEEANAAGGVLGKKLELVVRDAQLKPDIGANMARELILSEKCDFLIGPTSDAVALAVTKVAERVQENRILSHLKCRVHHHDGFSALHVPGGAQHGD